MNDSVIRLEHTLHELIPLSRAMGLKVLALDEETLTLGAPLALNHNHAGTAFAGSLYAIASLAGWAMLRQLVDREDLSAELVLGEARIRYHRPYEGELTASVHLPRAEQQRILDALLLGESARLRLNVHIPDAEQPAASFQGTYFARAAG